MKPCLFHSSARHDLLAGAEYYERHSPALAARFVEEMERLCADLGTTPQTGQILQGEIRRRLGEAFPYAVVYAEEPDHVLILAVAHHRRRPSGRCLSAPRL